MKFDRPTAITSLPWPRMLRLFVLAPHPDDFDEAGVTLRFFHERGCSIHVAVVSGSASGVLDEFCAGAEAKALAREQEQRESLQFFGLPENHLTCLRLPEDANGDPIDDPPSEAVIREKIAAIRPDIVFLPHGADTNVGHQRVFAMFRRVAPATTGFLIRDPKTVEFRTDLFMPFGAELAAWKRQLLLHHRSQEHRNRVLRGRGFDDRILDVNRQSAAELACGAPFAEAFALTGPGLETISS
jgi:LmbE family N-acetylglucosaminyl deacetylase